MEEIVKARKNLRESLQDLLVQSDDLFRPVMERIDRQGDGHRLSRMRKEIREQVEELAIEGFPSTMKLFILTTIELELHLSLLEEARVELGGWERTRSSCVDADFYDHFVLTLATQRVMRSWGWTVQTVPEQADLKTPDLMMFRDSTGVMAIEVKSKELLKDPGADWPLQNAERVVKTAVSGVGSSGDGQLRRGFPGLLVIAGYFLGDRKLALLDHAGKGWFRKHRGRRRSMVGILFVDLRAEQETEPNLRVFPRLYAKLVKNPSYDLHEDLLAFVNPMPCLDDPQFNRWGPDTTWVREDKV
jgi:hypothetical protein